MPLTSQTRRGLRPAPAVSAAIDRNPKLSPEQEAELILKAQNGDHAARQQVINANLAWICSLGGGSIGKGLEDDELLSEGVIALNRAIDQWLPDKGGDIRTYSKKKILKAQSEATSTVDPIRVPKSAQEQRAKLRKATAKLGEKATITQLAEEAQIREKRIEELQSISQPTSLNILVGKGDTELLDLQADSSDATLALELESAIEHLETREQTILRLRFLGGFTFQEIGDFFNLTNQRIQQIYKAALERLRVWLVGEKPEDLAQSQEFPEATQPIPAPALWEHLVFAKLVLATGFCRIFDVFARTLKRVKPRSSQRKKTSSPQSVLQPLHDHRLGLPGDSKILNFRNPAPPPILESETEVITHQINSGGLRDGPQNLLDSCWHGLDCLAQFLGDWPGTPQRRNQHRCCIRDRGRGRRQTQRRSHPKERLVSNDCRTVFLWVSHHRLKPRTKPKIDISNNILRFSRPSINQIGCRAVKVFRFRE